MVDQRVRKAARNGAFGRWKAELSRWCPEVLRHQCSVPPFYTGNAGQAGQLVYLKNIFSALLLWFLTLDFCFKLSLFFYKNVS